MALDREICAATAFMESSDQGPEGRRAVIHVLFNRAALSPKYGRNPADCALRAFQFSSWNTNDSNRHRFAIAADSDPIWLDCLVAFDEVMDGENSDETQGATHYYADSLSAPDWTQNATFTVKIGNHLFFKDVP